jgi:pimeloyl-ACP methyl ester carboxylesterase
MIPSFFGKSDAPLFGVYHPPRGGAPTDTGILLCYPAPQEYMRTHWAFRKLALLLAKEGFHVFRFDYFGTGDSAGDSANGSLETWRANVSAAAQELRDLASVSRISAVGFRLGASLAATAGISLADLVLWEPVVRGLVYLGELETIQARRLALDLQPPWRAAERPAELLGFPFPASMEEEIRGLDLVGSPVPRAVRTTIMVSEDRPIFRELHRSLSDRGANVTFRHVPDEVEAGRSAELQAALLSNAMLTAIAARLAGRS